MLVSARTCSGAHAPWREAVGRREAVEHADVLRRQELHELGVFEHLPLAVEDGSGLVGDVDDLSGDEGHGHGKDVLQEEKRHKMLVKIDPNQSKINRSIIDL